MAPDERNPWELAQEQLRKVIDEHSFNNWFSRTEFESCENGRLVIRVPGTFFAKWLYSNYIDVVHACVHEILPDAREVRFVPIEDKAVVVPGDRPPDTAGIPRKGAKVARRVNEFNPRYTFSSFVVGAGNRFAHAAARAVAESPARAYNPLFLYGGTGLGKTHLMQAIGQEIAARQGAARVVFISSEVFTNQLIESIARKSTQRFRDKYRKVDVLLIDDIHFIAGKEATQEEFFHTFNALFDKHKQIVISSDRQPKEIEGFEERLVSRFEWGLITDIQPPDLETRVAILQNRAAGESLTVPPEVLRYIATHITSNIRELEGALITSLAYSKLTRQRVTLKMVEEVLRDLIGRELFKPVTLEDIQRAVAEHFDVRISDLRGRSRQRQIAHPRQIAMFLSKKLIPSLSLNEVGEAFGGKDHTTVLHACRKIEKECEANSVMRNTIDHLVKVIRP